jgi:hypothetical protein
VLHWAVFCLLSVFPVGPWTPQCSTCVSQFPATSIDR